MVNLYSHQRQIIKDNKPKFGMFMGCGSGKTITALCSAVGNTLVIAPKTVRDDQVWEKDYALVKDISPIRHLKVISKEDLRLGKYPKDIKWDTLIGDEAHLLAGVLPDTRQKNYVKIPKTSQVFVSMVNFIKTYNPKKVLLLTATPTKSAMAVWGFAYLLGMRLDYFSFRESFYIKVSKGYREFWIQRSDDGAKDRLGKIVRQLGYTGQLSDYFDVPEQTFVKKIVELTKEQKKRLKEIETEYPDPIVLIGKKHQIEQGVLKGDEFSKDEEYKDNKVEALKEYALQYDKFVIFARYKAQISKYERELKKAGYKVLTLTGDTKNRQEVIKDAETSKRCIMIIQSQISAGYQLPSFPVMIFASLDYSLVNYVQAQGRILRANHLKKNLYIHLLSDGEIDRAVYKSIMNKEDFLERIYAEK